jgi:hypothetical protein
MIKDVCDETEILYGVICCVGCCNDGIDTSGVAGSGS